jgi:L-rhamnose-H+ transport protein
MIAAWLGIILSGILGGGFIIPAKRIKHLQWDQTWLIFCAVGLVIAPVGLVLCFAPGMFNLVFAQNPRVVLIVAGYGFGWGLGAFLFGSSIPRLGFALANAIVSGAVTLVGSVSPLMIGAVKLRTGEAVWLIAGLSLLTLGIGFCAWASILRDRNVGTAERPAPGLASSLIGVGLAVLSGVLSALLNTAFAYGGDLIGKATTLGISPTITSLAVWVPALAGGFAVNFLGTAWKIGKAKGWKQYQEAPAMDWPWAGSLGLIWFGGILVYGVSSLVMGATGTVYGWAVSNGVVILTSTAWGFASGEWKHASRAAHLWMLGGVVAFLIAFAILARS